MYHLIFPKKFIYIINAKFKFPITLLSYYLYDYYYFRRNCYSYGTKDCEHHLSRIIAMYHVIEKGLSFKNSKPFFGKKRVISLIEKLYEYVDCGGETSEVQFQSALKVLQRYYELHKTYPDSKNNDLFLKKIQKNLEKFHEISQLRNIQGGTINVYKKDLILKAQGSFPEMALSRYSIRNFHNEAVSEDVINNAIKWAQKSPSVCNRQCSRVYKIRNKNLIQDILTLQGGSNGFLEQVNYLLIITGDLRVFADATERNQIYFDTGLFSMSLMYGLHYQGVGSCPLNWCTTPEKDRVLRKKINISNSEIISVLIGVGSLDEKFKVCCSQRRTFENISYEI